MSVAEKNLDVLAWELVACGQKPPLHPTTCAVIRVLWTTGVISFREMCCVVPCDLETVRQQLNRLVNAGVAAREYVRHMGRKAQCLYRLTADGLRMVALWQVAAADMRKKLDLMLKMREGGYNHE